jgi:hypothetical protein
MLANNVLTYFQFTLFSAPECIALEEIPVLISEANVMAV